MVRICKCCDKEFDGYMASKYCCDLCRIEGAKKIRHVVNKESTDRNYKKLSGGSGGYVGVYYDTSKGKWRAEIRYNKVVYKLGNYSDKIDAIKARQKVEMYLFGKVLNEELLILTEEDLVNGLDVNEIVKSTKKPIPLSEINKINAEPNDYTTILEEIKTNTKEESKTVTENVYINSNNDEEKYIDVEPKIFDKIIKEQKDLGNIIITVKPVDAITYISNLEDAELLKTCNSIYDYFNNEFILAYQKFRGELSMDEMISMLIRESNNRFNKIKKLQELLKEA